MENELFMGAALHNIFGTDPMLGDPYDSDAPDFAPTSAVTPADEDITDADFPGGSYLGAIDPDGDDWTATWTAFP